MTSLDMSAVATDSGTESPMPQVLVVHNDAATTRLVRESLESFCVCEVVATPNAEFAFELALRREYAFFVFGLNLPVLDGVLLYELISKAYKFAHGGSKLAPAVLYIGTEADSSRSDELLRDARVKGVLMRPIRIEKLLKKGPNGPRRERPDSRTFVTAKAYDPLAHDWSG